MSDWLGTGLVLRRAGADIGADLMLMLMLALIVECFKSQCGQPFLKETQGFWAFEIRYLVAEATEDLPRSPFNLCGWWVW